METSQTPIIPIKQAMVEIAGHSVLSALLPGGQVAASIRMMCGLLCLDNAGQQRRILADPVIADSLILATMQIGGQQRTVYLLVAEAIPLWLADIKINKVAPEVRETLAEFQRVAVQTLRAFFFPEKKEPPHSAPPKQEPQAAPLPQAEQAASSVPALLRALAGHIEQEQRAQADEKARRDRQDHEVLTWRAEMEHRWRELQAEVLALRAARKDSPPVADAALSDEHEETLRVLLYCAERIVGQPMEQLEREMLAAAGVKKLGEIREADWFEMVVWLTQRMG